MRRGQWIIRSICARKGGGFSSETSERRDSFLANFCARTLIRLVSRRFHPTRIKNIRWNRAWNSNRAAWPDRGDYATRTRDNRSQWVDASWQDKSKCKSINTRIISKGGETLWMQQRVLQTDVATRAIEFQGEQERKGNRQAKDRPEFIYKRHLFND